MSDGAALTLIVIIIFLFIIVPVIAVFNNAGRADALTAIKENGCESACTRHGTHKDHVHDNMCVCGDGSTYTLDLSAGWRPLK